MKKKIIKHLHTFYKKIHKQHYTVLAIFIVLFASVSLFFITRGSIPHSSELSYIEHSILGEDSGSVVPASCESGTSHFLNDCTTTCWNGVVYDPYLNPGACVPPANCVGTPWGTVLHGNSVTGYLASVVNAPSSCTSQTRTCWNGTLSGTYPNTSCIRKSGTITVPASCIIAGGQSTCTVTASWVSANLVTPRFYDNNTNTTLSNAANGSMTVWVAYGGTTYKLTDSTLYNYDTKTVAASCAAGTTWNVSTGRCEYNATASLSANPIWISYNTASTLTWGSTYATNCTAGGAWSNSGTLNGSGSTGALTSTQTYTFQCTGLGAPSPVVSTTVNVCPAETPIWTGTICQGLPTINVTFTGQYTPNGRIDATGSNITSCVIRRDGVVIASGVTACAANISTQGNYTVVGTYIDANGIPFTASWAMWYQPIPPPPVVSLNANPSTIPEGSPTVISWVVTYPGYVQVPPRICTLEAVAVCTNGHSNCNAAQLAAEQEANNIITTGRTDSNDSGGPNRLIPTALNTVVNGNIITGATDWKAFGKKTFILNKSMDFFLNCGSETDASQRVRVLVTSSNEG